MIVLLRQILSAYSESIHVLHCVFRMHHRRLDHLEPSYKLNESAAETFIPFTQMTQRTNGATQANLECWLKTVPIRKRPSLRYQTNNHGSSTDDS